jgi:inner membrane protein
MTLYTHAFVGLGLGNVLTRGHVRATFWILAALLPVVPDFDSFSFRRYGDMLGHRGWTHSLTFALVLAALSAAIVFRYLNMRFWTLTAIFFVITASHGVLDALTFGGYGIPFFWPFYNERFGNWGPVRVPDIGFELPDPRRSQSIRGELLWVWVPMLAVVTLVAITRYFVSKRRQAGQ